MYRSSPFRSTLNTGYITCLGMCKVCTEAVHSVAPWTRVILRWDMCEVCTEAVHSVALWTCVPMQGTLSSPPPQPTPHHPSCVAFNMCGKNMPIPRGRKYVVSKNNSFFENRCPSEPLHPDFFSNAQPTNRAWHRYLTAQPGVAFGRS